MQVGFISLLQILFIGLKLGEVITWSWWLVLSPFLAVITLFCITVLVIAYAQYETTRGK